MSYFSAYILLVLGATISMSMAAERFDLIETLSSFERETADTVEEKKFNETIKQKSYTTFEKDNLVQTMNNLRRKVGSSDMPYIYWNPTMESDSITFTSKCNYDFALVTDGWGLKQLSSTAIDPVAVLKDAFVKADFYNGMRSVYLTGIGVDVRFCSIARVGGINYSSRYIGAFLFSSTSNFSDTAVQYSTGRACTTCRSYEYWCDGGLCREACSSTIYTCSCFESCANCEDWNRESCKCPSQPNTDAGTLQCYNRGETTYRASYMWATIVLSAVALSYLQ